MILHMDVYGRADGRWQVIEDLGGDEVDEALLTFQCMDHGETPRSVWEWISPWSSMDLNG